MFNNLAYNQSIEFFDLSLKNGNNDKTTKALALFWKAEALYRVGDYNNAINSYTEFTATPGASALPELRMPNTIWVIRILSSEDYESANTHFKKYLNASKGSRTEKQADALNRIGDFYFLNTDYTQAQQSYQQSYGMKIFEADYALYQIAVCKGLQRNQQGKERKPGAVAFRFS